MNSSTIRLTKGAGALVGILLGYDQLRDDLGRPRGAAEPDAGEEGLGERADLYD